VRNNEAFARIVFFLVFSETPKDAKAGNPAKKETKQKLEN
jgi:hypothetical protein